MPAKIRPDRPPRDLLTVELDPGTRADLDALVRIEAEASGAKSCNRIAAPLVRRLIRAERARHKADP